jgi:hypothetical protein
MMKRRTLALGLLALLLAGPGVTGQGMMGQGMTGRPGQGQAAQGQTPAPACDLAQGPCSLSLEGGLLVQFEILPRPILPLKELLFVVTLSRDGRPVEDALVEVDLSMPAMYMGRNRPSLVHVGQGRYEGRGVVTRCMSGDRRWLAELLIKDSHGEQRAAFPFETS